MYSVKTFSKEMRYLAEALQPHFPSPLTGYGAAICDDDKITLFVTYIHEKYGSISPRVKIDKKGDVYEPLFHGKQLSIVFDWLNRVGYDMERQVARTESFKRELIAKTGLSGAGDLRAGNDILG
jgi:hypothetical protein